MDWQLILWIWLGVNAVFLFIPHLAGAITAAFGEIPIIGVIWVVVMFLFFLPQTIVGNLARIIGEHFKE